MQPRAFIVHCWDGAPDGLWYPWLEQQLTAMGYLVCNLSMPDSSNPQMAAWVQKLKNAVGTVRPSDLFVGHSLGCQTIARLLQKQLNTCAGIIFVAGWLELKNLSEEEHQTIAPWLSPTFPLANVTTRTRRWAVLLSDDDPWVDAQTHKAIFEEVFKDRVHVEVLPGRGHFDDPEKDKTLPEVLPILKRWGLVHGIMV